jgi:antitoxin component YwqK of YwqJK toxin-antitoxin module
MVSLLGCPKVSCPSGQEAYEEHYPGSKDVRARGCVDKEPAGAGRMQGKWEYLYQNGKKEAEGEYRGGDLKGQRNDVGMVRDGRDGVWTMWYPNGQQRQLATFRGGRKEGVATEWYDNGKKKWEGSFKGGKEVAGSFTDWDEQGTVVKKAR